MANNNDITMQDLCDVNAISVFGVDVSQGDIGAIADTLARVLGYRDRENVIRILHFHWNNMTECIKIASENESKFLKKRRDIFGTALERKVLTLFPDDGQLIAAWSEELAREIEKGRLEHFSQFKNVTFQTGTLTGFFKGKRYHFDIKKITHFFRTAKRQIGSFNEKAFGAIEEFVDFARDGARRKPWISPVFIFVIILLVLFTVCGTAMLDIAFGTVSVIYRIGVLFCQICTVHYDSAGALSLAKVILKRIGIV